MKDIHAHPSTAADLETLDRWLTETPANCFDREILLYTENLRFLTASAEGKPIAHLPYQLVLMLESFAPNPEAADGELARALGELVRYVLTVMHEKGINELYFIGSDPRVCRIAERRGFSVLLHDRELGRKLFVVKARQFRG